MKKTPKRILVIDDDPSMLKLLEKWLQVAGREVMLALTGEDGLAQARETVPDLIVIDLMLPDIDGVKVMRRLKADPALKDIPLIFISSTVGVEHDQGDERIEADGQQFQVFAKPLHNPRLLSAIRKAINRRTYNSPAG